MSQPYDQTSEVDLTGAVWAKWQKIHVAGSKIWWKGFEDWRLLQAFMAED